MKSNQHDQQESDLPLELSMPARRALVEADYTQLDQLTEVSEAEVKQMHGVGPKAIGQLRDALGARGLSFAGGMKGRTDIFTNFTPTIPNPKYSLW